MNRFNEDQDPSGETKVGLAGRAIYTSSPSPQRPVNRYLRDRSVAGPKWMTKATRNGARTLGTGGRLRLVGPQN